MFNTPSRRIYLGRLPSTFQREDVEKHLSSYGTIVECKVMDGFGFVEFLNLQDAEDVVDIFSRQPFLGEHIVCEFAKPMRKSLLPQQFHDANIPPAHAQLRYCVWVFNLSEWTRWQDLKDFGRAGGATVAFSDIDSMDPTLGFIEYLSSEDAKRAAKLLDKTELRGNTVRVKTQQQINRDRQSRRSRSRSPGRRPSHQAHSDEQLDRGRDEYARDSKPQAREERYSQCWEPMKHSAWSLHGNPKYFNH